MVRLSSPVTSKAADKPCKVSCFKTFATIKVIETYCNVSDIQTITIFNLK